MDKSVLATRAQQQQYDTEWRRWFHENVTVTSCAAARLRTETGENYRMHIQLTGQARQLPSGATIATLLETEGLAERRVAVEVNGTILPRAQHVTHLLGDGDQIEIVHALGGG